MTDANASPALSIACDDRLVLISYDVGRVMTFIAEQIVCPPRGGRIDGSEASSVPWWVHGQPGRRSDRGRVR